MSTTQVKKILILTANPINTEPLRLSEEVREIKASWERSTQRQQFEIIVEEAVRPKDLRRTLLTHKPNIVHFSGHGSGEDGLVLIDDSGEALLVPPGPLARFFRTLQEIFPIDCVLLNACYSEVQAQGIYPYVDYVVGMNYKIGDQAARKFAIGFYDTIFSGEAIESAFALGRNAIEMENIPEYLTPILKKRTDIKQESQAQQDSIPIPEPAQPRDTEKSSIQISKSTQPRDIKVFIPEDIDGQVPLNSPFYIERPPVEGNCYGAIVKPGALIRIKAPRQMGKTSLMSRILNHGAQQNYKTVFVNLWNRESFRDIDTFLQWFCANLSEELEIEENLEKYWKKILGSQKNCTNYLRKYLLKQLDSPVILGLDEVDQVFQYPNIAKEFFGLLRAWHERGKNEEIWQKLRIVISHSKEVYIPLNFHQSPFNVGLPIELGEFNLAQVQDLVQRHHLNWSNANIQPLMGMVDGHPYLLRAALYHIATGHLTLEHFLQVAPTEEGIYGDHLYRHLLILEEDPSLKSAMQEVVNSNQPVRLEPVQAFKLRSMGLVESKGNEVMPLCNLYRIYFRDRLTN